MKSVMQRLFDSEIEALRLFPSGGFAKDGLGDDWKPAPDTVEASAGIGRREFITLLGGALLASPLTARAQQDERLRHIGVLMTLAAIDPQAQARNAAFLQGLHELGWTIGRNVQIDHRWATGGVDDTRRHAAELAALTPDVILASGSAALESLLLATRTVPIVFVVVPDPVGAGFVDSLARPGGNATGFTTTFEYGIGAKWLELLKQIAPGVTRAAVILDPVTTAGTGQWSAIQAVAPTIGLATVPVNIRDGGMNRTLAALARASNVGLIVTASAFSLVHRDAIVELAARLKLPAVYYGRSFVAAGGLISYGHDFLDQYRRAGTYVDRILKGEKPADLPVQTATRYEIVMNRKTARALGLDIPATVLARVDEVME
jgi:putative ABC transport system substrate-binding protein